MHDLFGLGLNFAVVCAIGFLTNFRDILDFAVLDPNLNIPETKKLGAPSIQLMFVQWFQQL
jgi:hypothetical protein